MTLKNSILLAAVFSGLTFIVTRYYFPQIQTKVVETTKEVVRTDIQTVVHTITSPNGTTDTITTTVDHTVKSDTSNKTAVTTKQPNWLVSGSVTSNFKLDPPTYGLQVNRRILGPVFVGALLNTKGDVGLSLGFEF